MAIVMALLSGFAGVYTEAIIKKRPSRNINVQNFWLYIFGMCFNCVAMLVQDFDAAMNKGFFHGYSLITVLMIFNHALSGIAVSMVMKYADNIVKVYSTSVAMLLTAVVSVFLFGFHLSLAFFLGTVVNLCLQCCLCCNLSALCWEDAKISMTSAFCFSYTGFFYSLLFSLEQANTC
ncbi:hypothetical protein ACSQ67_026194 [Phaseolus vulgaris]